LHPGWDLAIRIRGVLRVVVVHIAVARAVALAVRPRIAIWIDKNTISWNKWNSRDPNKTGVLARHIASDVQDGNKQKAPEGALA
jgi:hypothetical protein